MVSTNTVDEFLACFCPWKYQDIETAIEMYENAGKHFSDLANDIQGFAEEMNLQLESIDICAVAMDNLVYEACTDIQDRTNVNILNDEPYCKVNVVGNYMATQLDGRDEDRKALQTLIETIEPVQRSEVVEWLLGEVIL